MNKLIKTENEKAFTVLVDKYLKKCNYDIVRENEILQFIFRGKSEETEITIYCDPDELTVGIGEHFHTHFDMYSSEQETDIEKYKEAGKNAIGFIQAFMRNEIWLEVTFRGNEDVEASICDKNDSYSVVVPVETSKKKGKESKRIFKWDK